MISLVLVLLLLIGVTPPIPRAQSAHARRSVTSETSWSLNIGSSFYLLAAWLTERIRRKSPEHVTAPPVTAYLNPLPPFLDAPSNLAVTAASNSSIGLSWTAPAGSVDHYQIERSQHVKGPFLLQGTSAGTTYTDSSVSSGNGYLYRVRAIGSGGVFSTPSNMALGTAVSFEFSQLQGQLIKAQHIYDLRAAVNAVRSVANLAAASWTVGTLSGAFVQASAVQELRDKLDEALLVLSINAGGYQDPTLATGASGTLIKAIHLEQLQTRSTSGSSSSSGPIDSDSSTARVDPLNETGGGGENPLSRNFNWNLPLVSLPGRAGLDLGLSLSYNSLVWTKSGNSTISFNDDRGFPGPGFRLGFPTIQMPYFNSETGKNAFLLIGSDGGRTELRQVAATSVFYESADSAHLLLDVTQLSDATNPRMLLLSGGSQLTYKFMGLAYECTEIKDRNGNYITINYNTSGAASGRIANIHDTLDRTISFNYDANGWLTSITQQWKRQPPNQTETITHTWATFDYINLTVDTNFSGLTVIGPADQTTIRVLSKVTLDDNSTTPGQNSHVDFAYTSWGQVWQISRFAADNHLLNRRSYNLPQDASIAYGDCPRFTERRDWGQWANGDTDATPATSEEIVTTYGIPAPASWTMPDNFQHSGVVVQVTAPDGTFEKIYFADTVTGIAKGWLRGLPEVVESYDVNGTVPQRQVFTSWQQDNETISYELNPRVKETNIFDPSGNRKRTEVTYQSHSLGNGMSCQLPQDILDYAANASAVLRTTRTTYIEDAGYDGRRMILTKEKLLYEGAVSQNILRSKVEFNYDEANSIYGNDAPVQHDSAYGSSFIVGRGNVSSVKRYDVDNLTQFTTSTMKYNTAGAVVSSKDALDHEVKVSYIDDQGNPMFSDGVVRNTLAYPTKVADPDGYWSSSIYNFDFGAVTSRKTPPANYTGTPAEQPAGPEQQSIFDDLGRLERVKNLVNNAYTRFEYPSSKIRVDTFATLVENQGEAHSFTITDGFGRAIASASDHAATPGTSARFDAQRIEYDIMGRFVKTSNPAETSAIGNNPAQWTLVEGDAGGNWVYTQQTYDWKGRPLVTTNPDGTTKTASYSSCGCAGGEVVTLTDEGTIEDSVARRRQQRIYSDVLGRTWKTEILNWQNGSPYSTVVNTYNARDQVEQVRQYAGLEGSATFQDTLLTYDGYGRLKTEHRPEQAEGTNTIWDYNSDNTIQRITDARGATNTFTYNDRHLVSGVVFGAPAGISPTPNVSLAYDAGGNKTSISDGTGNVSFGYDQLSRLTSETRYISALARYYHLTYGYNLAGILSSVAMSDWSQQINYGHDSSGRLTSVTGSGFTNTHVEGSWPNFTYVTDSIPTFVSGITYRAWGAVKKITYANNTQVSMTYNSRMLSTQYQIGLKNWDGSNATAGNNYTYYDDGKINYAGGLDPGIFDRKFTYDQVGRIKEALTGSEARGSSTADGPFRQSYGYDVWDNTTSQTHRLWTGSTSTDSYTFSNNRRADFGYNANGIAVSTYDESLWYSHDYDAAGKRTHFVPQIGLVGGLPVVETSDTYDGAGFPIARIDTQRWQDPETGQIQTNTTTSYSLHSTALSGAVIATLDAQGNKSLANIYAQGMQIATEVINNSPAYARLEWQHTEPVTGSSLKTNFAGNQLSSQELDPLGADVTSPPPPPDPFNYEAPEYLNPKFASSPIEIEGGPSAEYQQANADWGAQMDDMYDRGLAEYFWGKGDRDAVQAILARNPNVGIQYNRVGFGLPSVSGSVFGMEAAKVLNALGTLLDEGIFVQIGGPGFSGRQAFAHAPQDPVPVPGPTPAPHVKPCDRNGVKYNQEELDDLAENLGGKITYTKPGKPDSEAVITNLKGRPTFSQFESRLRENNWNEIWFNMSPEHWGGEDWKRQGKYGNWYHITVYPKKLSHRLRTEAKNLWPPTKITIHCDNGNPQDPFHER